MPAFIPDGYTMEFFLAGMDGQYEGVWVKGRPALPGDVTKYLQDLNTDRDREDALEAAFIAERVVDWSITYPDGSGKVAITPENLSRLNPQLRSRIINVLQGYASPDKPKGPSPFGGKPVPDHGLLKEVDERQKN